MRYCLTLFFISFFLITIQAQEDPYLAVADEMPTPIGGYGNIYNKVVYPETARKSGVEGKVYLLVYVSETGNVDDVKVIKGIGAGCENAAQDVLKKAKFNPGKIQGQATKVKLTVPVAFKMTH